MSDNLITLIAIKDILSESILHIPTGIGREKVTEANIHLLNLISKMHEGQSIKVEVEHFQYHPQCAKYISENDIEVVGITDAGRYSEGCVLFYRKK